MSDQQPEAFPGTYPGTIQAPPDFPSLIAAADLICLGEVGTVRDDGEKTYLVRGTPVRFRRRVASFVVERTYKGSAGEDPLQVEFLESEVPSTLTVLLEGE